jgi:hypothetical protein
LYLTLIALSFWDIWRIRHQARQRYNASWILSYCTMFEATLTAFAVGSMFLNRAHFDLFYHVVAIVMMLGVIARHEMENEEAYPRRATGSRGPLTAVQPTGFGRRPAAVDGFARSPAGASLSQVGEGRRSRGFQAAP